jgi:quinolinate synthase
MEKRSPGKHFHAPSVGQVCPDMKLNTVEKIIYALETFEPAVEMDESLRTKGLQPLERMLELAEVKTHAQL